MKNILLSLFAIAALVLAALLWQQTQRVKQLEFEAITAANSTGAARKQFQEAERRLAETEKARAEIETEVKSLRSRPAAAPRPARATDPMAAANAMLDNPNFQRVMATSMKGNLDQRYAALFRQLKLSPADLDKFKDLLVEKQMSGLDVVRLAQARGAIANPADLAGAMNKVQGDVDESVHALLGDQGFQHFQEFNQNSTSYALLDQIERRLSYTNAPLQETQSEALLQVLKNTTPASAMERTPGGSAMAGFVQGFAGSNPMLSAMTQRPISNETIDGAKTVLSPPQMDALKQLQLEQQSQASTMQNLRGALAPGGGGGQITLPSPGTPPAPTPPPR